MALLRPLMMQASGADAGFPYSAQEHRQMVQAVLSAGVIGSGALLVTQRAAGANFTLDVAAGKAAVVGTSVAAQGSYLVTNDAPITDVTVPAAPASGTRTHRVVLKVLDRAHDGTVAAGTYAAAVQLLEDTGTGTPAVPASAINLALVAVAAGTTSITNANITSTRTLSTSVLGAVPSWRISGGNGQTINSGVDTRYIGFSVESFGLQSSATNGVTIGRAGLYMVSFGMRFTSNAVLTALRERYVSVVARRGGAILRPMAAQSLFCVSEACAVRVSGIMRLEPGDVIHGQMSQNTGGSLNIDDAFGEASFDGVMVGA